MGSDDVYRATGRGGAGNIAPMRSIENSEAEANKRDQKHVSGQTVFSAGRGGAGNIATGIRSEELLAAERREATKEQEAASREESLTPSSSHIGRGGFGNIRPVNSGESVGDKKQPKSLLKKVKNLLK